MKKSKLIQLACAVLVLSTASHASLFRSTKGYLIRVPDGWKVVPAEQLKSHGTKGDPIDCQMYNTADPFQCLSILVLAKETTDKDMDVNFANAAITKMMRNIGLTVEKIWSKPQAYGKGHLLESCWFAKSEDPKMPEMMMEQVLVPINGRTYMLEYSARAGGVGGSQKEFADIAGTFQPTAK